MNIAHPNVDFDNTASAFSHQTDAELRKAYWLFSVMNSAALVKIGSALTQFALRVRLPVKPIIRNTVFEHFCGGETIEACQRTIKKLGKSGVGTILDYSVEGEDSASSFDHTLAQLLRTVETAALNPKDIPFAVFKVTGLVRSVLLGKIQNNTPLSEAEKSEYAQARNRILTLCGKAHDLRVRIFFDAEESWIQNTIDDLSYEMMRLFNREEAIIYNTYQFYRADMSGNYAAAIKRAEDEGYKIGAKLVRGAYMEKEAARADELGYKSPIHNTKAAVDDDYNEAVRFSLTKLDSLSICLGTHNELSCRRCMNAMQQQHLEKSDKRIFFAQLLGMSDNISFNMASAGYNVAKYVPFGPIEAVMPYLFRRANENTAIAGQSSREFLLIKKELQRRKRR
ncbi:proline dehydrogenase family protein [Ravibacter arvi]|uniref:Proline dehydrogenase family protein n=1 Tax=Ravibacter arvi TaxID=2051041 RepID=A0ABP8MAF2_9BACT